LPGAKQSLQITESVSTHPSLTAKWRARFRNDQFGFISKPADHPALGDTQREKGHF
jgi:hypothetical protein